MRGIKGSKAKHIDLKTYYNLINEDLNVKQSESIQAYAKENYLNRKKVQELQETLQNNEEIMESCNKIIKANKELKESKKLYEHTIKTLAAKYKIPEKDVIKILNSNKAKEVQKRQQRERGL